MFIKKAKKISAFFCGLIFFSLRSFSCDQTSINVLSATNNGNGTYTYTVQICLGVDPNWGGTDNITIDADVPIVNSGFTPSVTTNYNYCNIDLVINGQNCLTSSGNYMGVAPAGGSMIAVTATATGSVGGGNLTYNGTNDLAPGDTYAPAGSCNDCGNPDALCFNVTFTTTGAMTTVQLNNTEQDNNNCGAGTCCPDEIDNTVPVPVSGCTPPTASFTSNSPECIGSTFSFTNTGTMTGVTWSWSFPSGSPTSSTAQNPSATWSTAGSFAVVQTTCLTAQPTCCSNFSQTIQVDAPPTLSATSTGATCGLSNGALDLTVTGGEAPYFYNWSNGATSQDLSAIASGSYTVTVTDNNGCIATATYSVTNTGTPPTCGFTVSGSTCLIGNSLSFSNTGTSGGGTTYSWTFSGGTPATSTSQNPSNITWGAAGTYTITQSITKSGCTATCTQTVTINPNPTVSFSPTNPSCTGACDGAITASGATGTSPYTYSWSGGLGTGATKSALCAGSYTVTVTDANGCTGTNSVTLTAAAAITSTFTINDNTQCITGNSFNFTNTGTSGGGATYSWTFPSGTPASSTTNNPTGVTWSTSGTYTITHTVTQGSCSSSTTGTITVFSQPTVSITPVNPSCNATCDGSVSATGAGGTPGYTYTWSGGLGAGATKSSLCAGSYSITVTDANGCTGTNSTTLTAPPVLTVTATSTNAACNGVCSGSLSASGSGGTSPYTYSWSGGLGSGATKSSVCDGTYTVTITDNKGCTATASATVNEPTAIVPSASATNATCNGTCNGSVSASATGGTTGYTFNWSGGLGTGATKSSVCAGIYNVTITDANGCTATTSATVGAPPALTVTPSATNASCNGTCNGTVSASAAGGTTGYTYNWSGGLGMGSPVSGVCDGVYTVTVTDANGCTVTGTATVNEPAVLSVTVAVNPASCNGTCNGSLTATATGGTTGYTYSWNGGLGTGATKSSVCQGTYSVTVTDANGCTATASGTVSEPALLVASASGGNPTCNGTCNGSLSGSGSGGVTPYTYSWSGGLGAGATKSSVCAGTYTVTVTDANGCTKTAFVTLTAPTTLTATASATPASCNGTCNGTLTSSGSGGTTGYTYTWSGGLGSGATKSAVCDGPYSVTVTDANGCTATAATSVTEPAALTGSVVPTNATCNATCNGQLSASGTGGVSPYTYSWNGGLGSGATKTGVCAGSYSVTITDANGCTFVANGTISQPTVLSASAGGSNASCNGVCNGSATASPTGGTSPYTYQWSLSASSQASQTATGLCAGAHTVTITDNNGCTATAGFTVTQPAAITLTPSSTNATCGNSNGTGTVVANGGTSPYSYVWCNSQTSSTATGLPAGGCNVTVTDANGCSANSVATVNSVGGPAVNISSSTNISCNGGNNGSATASVIGGTTPYTYSWSPSGGTGSAASNLTAGTYTINVTDNNGCIASATVTLTAPAVLISSITSSSNITCNALCNGSATVTASGGTTNYSYLWPAGAGSQTTATATGLCVGSFTVTVTDSKGCTTTSTASISQPPVLTASATATAATCNGSCNGSINMTSSGGTTSYSYAWSNSATTEDLTALCAGPYTVTVTDANGCTATASATVNQPAALALTTSTTTSTCGNSNGTATVAASGGTTGYTYLWQNAQTSAVATGMAAGSYTVTVTDANGCTATATATVTDASAPTITISSTTNVFCFGGNNGSASSTVSGGASPYTYLWSPSGGTGANASGLAAGSYTVTVTDNNGCTAIASTSIIQPGVLGAVISASSNISCNGLCNGSATVAASGGTSPYTYFWSAGGTSATKTGLCTGTVTVTVSDANGCAATTSVTITQPTALTASLTGTNTLCNASCNGAVNLTASGGSAPYIYNWSNTSTTEDLSSVCSGSYTVTVTDNNLCTATASVTINEPTAISSTSSSVNSTCGNSNGQACVAPVGGTSPYSYSWNSVPVQTSSCATGVAAGNYTVTVTDANGCSYTTSVIVSNSSGGTASATVITNATGAGLCNGSASAAMTGGTSPYTYLWGNGQTSSNATGLCAGTVCVTVTDANGCASTACVIITEPGAIITSTIVTNVTCNGACNGAINLTVSGGVSPYTYNWSSGATAQDPANLCNGTYTVTVTDNNGNTATTSANISQPTAISISGSVTNLVCNNACAGAINIAVSGGTTAYSYSWSNTSSAEDVSSLCAGSYTVTVTDANLCTANSTFTISQPTALSLSTSSTNASCGNANGSASVTASGGTSPYTYTWSAGSTASTQPNVAVGTYTVTVSDNNGCTSTATVSVNNNSTGVASGTVINDVLCFGGSSGQAAASITGGQSPFTYSWSNGDVGTNADSLAAGTHTVSVTDVNGCITTATVFITQPTIVDPGATGTDATCNGNCDGTVTGTASGGTSPYTYTWSGGLGIGTTISNVCAGSYSVTVTDTNGCTSSASTGIGQPSPVVPVPGSVNSTCNQSDGQASVTVTGGTSPYTYLWSNAGNSTTPVITGIPAGTYTVTITDASGCIITSPVTVNDNAAPSALASETSSITCNGVCDGAALVTVSGGTTPYTIIWSNGDIGNTADTLCAGTVSVNITDATGCSASSIVSLTQPALLSAAISGSSVTCFGGNNGFATATENGGTAPYSYLWSDGSVNPVNDSLAAGTYTVTVTDNKGCKTTTSLSIAEPAVLAVTANATATLCNGSCSGTLSGTASGGTSPYTYSWSNGLGNNATVNNVCTGTYTLIVTDGNFCSATDTAMVNEPIPLTSATTVNDISCNSLCNGSVSDTAAGGTLPYSFLWSGGLGSGANHNNVCAGTYSVTVTDANGCTSVQTATVSEPAALALSVLSTNISCNGVCDGAANTNVSGGTSPYSYIWDNTTFDTTPAISNLCAGTFNVTVTDANGCVVNGNAAVTQPAALVTGNSTSGSTCGQADGSATVTIVSGGVTPYAYQWASNAGNQVTATATGLAAGCYNVTVTDGNSCAAVDNICVSDLGAPTVSLLTKTNTSCFGSCDGFAQIAVSGGNPPYNYTWYNSTMVPIGQTTASAFNLCAGTYIGSMVDSTGCTGSISVIITQPTAVNGIITASDSVNCFGSCDGMASAAGSGGIAPFTYQWNDLLSQTGATATGLCPGNYSVIISDANSCDTTISVNVGEPVPMSLVINTSNAYCATPSGQACVTVADGTSPFTNLWNDGQTTQCAGNLIPGTYSVTVTDFNGCTAGATGTVGNTAAGTATISNLVDASCNGVCDGSATVSMSGSGTTPYSYSWSNGSTAVTSTGLCAGNYTVTVTDANNCASITSITVAEPPAMAVSTAFADALCFGVCDGNASVSVTGGTAPYVYVWDDILTQTNDTATALCSGNYSVTVSDDNNCAVSTSVSISEPPALQLSSTVFDANCGQSNGNACVVVSGGVSPYTYNWAGGQTNQCINNVTSGSYNISVTDANGCTGFLGVSVQDLNGPIVTLSSKSDATCNGSCDGVATISMSGGAGQYVIGWYDNLGNSIFQVNPTASNLCPGNYSATVTDSAGCSASIPVTINEPAAISYSSSSVNPTCNGACSGSASVAVSGGTSPYSYQWSDSQNQISATATGLCAGSYTLTIGDTNNCTVFTNVTLSNPSAMSAVTADNPTSCSGVCDGSATLTVFNGNAPLTYQWDSGTGNQTTQQAINLCGGTYSVTVTDATGCSATASAAISQPASMAAIINTFGNVSCNGDCNGYAQVSVTGGSPGYIYSWSDGQINQVASNLCSGAYFVTVMDINGCTDTAQVLISQPQVLSASINKTNVTCYGNCDGSAILNATGGTPSYTYLWSASTGFQNTSSATGLCGGAHSVTITDGNGCSKTASANIIEPTPIGMVVTYFANANCGQNNGQICVNAMGGTVPYSYQWNDPYTQTSSCADSLFTGCYTINITDGSGCTTDSVVCISDVAGPVITLVNSDSVKCSGDANGVVEFAVSGGISPYTYEWYDGSGTLLPINSTLAFGLNGGNYTIEVTDGAGCISAGSEFVYEPNAVVAAITSTINNNCFGQSLGQATVSVAGGTLPYSYQWDANAANQSSPTATGLSDGNYFVTVSDINNCSKILNVIITEPDSIEIASVVVNATCFDTCNGSVNVTAIGGTAPYYYNWSPNSSTNASAFNLCDGAYNTTITDNNGCVSSINSLITEPSAISAGSLTVDATCGSCNGQGSITLSGGTPNYSYLWVNGQTDTVATGLCAGINPVTITDAKGCKLNLNLNLMNIGGPVIDSVLSQPPKCTGSGDGEAVVYASGGTPVYTFEWSDSVQTQNDSVYSLSGGNYFVTVTDANGCFAVQGVNITEPPMMQAIGTGDTTICYGQFTQIWTTGSGGSGSYVYQWTGQPWFTSGPHTVSPTDTTVYSFTVVDDFGCSASGTITVSVRPALDISLNDGIDTVNICFKDSTSLCAVASGGNNGPYTYTWATTNFIDSVSSPSCQPVNPLVSTNYIVIASDGCSVNDTDTVAVMVRDIPIASFVTTPDKGCPPLLATFTSVDPGTNISNPFYSWDFNGDGIFDDDTVAFPQFVYTEPDTYTVSLIVTSEFGCADTFSVPKYIIIHPLPTAGFEHTPAIGNLINPDFTFITDGLSIGATSWEWDFGDEETGSGASPVHTYNDTGTYLVTLVVRNNEGCLDTIQDTVRIETEFNIYVPNAFTPNGNDKNEFFMAKGVGIDLDNYVMYIFDRWGDLIWETHDLYKGWDGTANGGSEMVQQDVYVWLIICYDLQGNRYRLIGHVTVVK